MKYKIFIILVLFLLLLTACSKNEKCIKSHKEIQTCMTYRYISKSNGGFKMIPIYYSCEKEVCDLYESEE